MIGKLFAATFVLPVNGSYVCPPAKVIETFWACKYSVMTAKMSSGNGDFVYGPVESVADDEHVRLMYKEVDPVTGTAIGDDPAIEMAAEVWESLISTKDHPGFC
jgi:hypothetical protein